MIGRQYVVGFLFRRHRVSNATEVALIQKRRPAWQCGKLNGIGGKVEPNESLLDAMRREFVEEAGVYVQDWRHVCSLAYEHDLIHFHCAWRHDANLVQCTDEEVSWYPVSQVARLPVIPNLRWLVPMALDPDVRAAHVVDHTAYGQAASINPCVLGDGTEHF